MTAETIARALGGHRAGATWMARCPVHEDRSPSLSISAGKDGKVLVRCHAGCDQRDLIAALQERGLWQTTGRAFGHRPQSSAADCRGTRRRRPEAQRGGAGDLAGIASGRGNARRNLSAFARARPSGFAGPALPCRPETPFGRRLAAMVALSHGGARDAWRHRIADRHSPHLSRPRRRRQGAGRSGEDDARALSRRRGAPWRTRRRADGRRRDRDLPCRHAGHGKPAWAALSTSGLRSLDLPHDVRDVIVLADGDEPGEAAAQHCARRWQREGRRVRIARPPQGMDFNDLLKARNPSLTEGAR